MSRPDRGYLRGWSILEELAAFCGRDGKQKPCGMLSADILSRQRPALTLVRHVTSQRRAQISAQALLKGQYLSTSRVLC